MSDAKQRILPDCEWLDKPIESPLWTNLTFLKDGRCLKSIYNLPSEEFAKRHAMQSEEFLNNPDNGPIFKNQACGTLFGKVMFSHIIQIPVKP